MHFRLPQWHPFSSGLNVLLSSSTLWIWEAMELWPNYLCWKNISYVICQVAFGSWDLLAICILGSIIWTAYKIANKHHSLLQYDTWIAGMQNTLKHTKHQLLYWNKNKILWSYTMKKLASVCIKGIYQVGVLVIFHGCLLEQRSWFPCMCHANCCQHKWVIPSSLAIIL